MNIEIIKRLHNVYDDMILGNIELAHKELGKILNDEQLTLTDVVSSTSSGITITNVDIQLLKRQWWQIYKKGWHKHQDFYNRKWWIKYNG